MANRAAWWTGGLAVGLLGGAVLGWGASAVAARSPARQVPDVHAEYVKYASGTDSVTAYIAYPNRAEPAPAVLVIHEIFGMSDFVRDATRRLAQNGYVALAPDLLSRRGGTPASPDSARQLIASLNRDTITQDLDAAFTYLQGLKPVQGAKIVVMGFCWGGGESFRYATHNQSLRAFVVCYGPAPAVADLGRIRARGYGVYAERDTRINQDLMNLDFALRHAKVDYRFKVYRNTEHAFLRTGSKSKVADEAWHDLLAFLEASLRY
jgi:carboxymethylenebutenolidase